jgi:hypothetical protein
MLTGHYLLRSRRGREPEGIPLEIQWPFDQIELRNLMDDVIQDQRNRINQMTDPAARHRAAGFLQYYQDRRAAAAI